MSAQLDTRVSVDSDTEVSADSDARENPYPGLRPFQVSETHLFFGRDHQRTELLGRLRRSRFLAVVGTSGCGKSSLVRAGLLPGLYGGFMAGGSSRWRVVDTRPGDDPIGRLGAALDDALGDGAESDAPWSFTEATLRRSPKGLAEAVKEARLDEADRVLVLVDQFEELFRFTDSVHDTRAVNDASAFVKLLLHAAGQSEVPIYVVLTMRSDFLGDCARFRDLPEAINDAQYLIPRLTRDERREAIAGPAAVQGATLSPALMNRLLNDVGDDPDQLPILQHALMRTWDAWKVRDPEGSMVELEDYEAVGGMKRALSLHAQSVLQSLGGEDEREQGDRKRKIAEKLFKCLTKVSPQGQRVRRLAQLREVAEVADVEPEEVAAVADEFRKLENAFLMPPDKDALTPDTYLDISHESLIRNWKTLRDWVGDEARSATTYRRLADSAHRYPDEEDLLDGQRLRVPLQWREEQHPTPVWAARYDPHFEKTMKFLADSEDAQIRLARIRRSLKGAALLALLIGILLVLQWNIESVISVVNAESRQEADTALIAIYSDWGKFDKDEGLSKAEVEKARTKLVEKIKDLEDKLVDKETLQTKSVLMDHWSIAAQIRVLVENGADLKMTEPHSKLLEIFSAGIGDKRDRLIQELKGFQKPPLRLNTQPHVRVAEAMSLGAQVLGFLEKYAVSAGIALLALMVPVVRWLRLRKPLEADARSRVAPIWRAGAAVTDLGVAIVLGACAGILVAVPLSIGFRLGSDDPGGASGWDGVVIFAGAIANVLVAASYLLFRDSIKFKVHRSLGKIVFGLRPIRSDGTPMSKAISVKHNGIFVSLFVLCLVGLVLLSESSNVETANLLAGLLGVAAGISCLLWLALASFGQRRTLSDRIAGTRVVDIRTNTAPAETTTSQTDETTDQTAADQNPAPVPAT